MDKIYAAVIAGTLAGGFIVMNHYLAQIAASLALIAAK